MAEYIEREALYKRINELADEAKYKALRLPDSDTDKIRYVGIWGGLCDALYVVRSLMTADVAPVVHGRWDGDTCTHCKLPWNYNMVQDGDDCGYFDPMPDLCPNCGAKMDKEADDAQ